MARFSSLSRGLSLRTKVFFLFAGAALLIVVPTLGLIARAVENRVYERATEELEGAGGVLANNWRLRDELLLREAAAQAGRQGLVAALEAQDTAWVRSIVRSRLGRGRVILAADSAARPLFGPSIDATLLRSGQGIGSIVTLPDSGQTPLRVAVYPVWGDSGQVGIVGVGTRLDTTAVRELKKDVTGGTEVALVVGDSILGSTLADSVHRVLRDANIRGLARAGTTGRVLLGGALYQYRVAALPTRGVPAVAVLLRPVGNELQVVTGIVSSLVGVGIAALFLALVLALVVARIVARPAQILAEASARLARGDFRAPLPPASGDEVGQLARAFAEMRSA
ncbi:MAG TPA: HAMP domain-containing protein, partial [Longimicrobiaceae bacterium]|nr:HAMP domain-containing protein [Longimicrobiaceae bacterium]